MSNFLIRTVSACTPGIGTDGRGCDDWNSGGVDYQVSTNELVMQKISSTAQEYPIASGILVVLVVFLVIYKISRFVKK